MIRPIHLAFGSFFSIFALACSGGDDPPPATPPLDPTFTNVMKQVINELNCGGPLCHSTAAGGFQLGPKDALHAALVDQPASGAKCRLPLDAGPGAPALILVIAGNPDESLLFMKLTARQPCGDTMPATAKTLKREQIDLVREWIADGAKND
jgi:hypothetical protein